MPSANVLAVWRLFSQITSIQGDQVVLIGHRRLRITEMVSSFCKIDRLGVLSFMTFYKKNTLCRLMRIHLR